MLKIYNTLTNQKDTFVPIEKDKVNMYVCGMTVYDYCHLGHARVMVVFDVVVRYLRLLGYDVTYVRNITDIDDKIIRRANENGEHFRALTERFIAVMNEDADALGVVRPDLEPKASESMEQILAMIGALLDKGYAYQGNNGDVYYDVSRFDNYGRLSGKNPADLQAGARIEVDESKHDPLDFVLWKHAKPDEPSWDSPWGAGRPGWHIECSAMSTQHLGEHFDIHGGGMDLKFPHHENEVAQSEAATGEPFVNYWMHNGFVRVDDEKMSKSLGNFFTVRDILKRYRAEEVRYFIVASHYRSPLNYSQENLENGKAALTRLYTALRGITPAAPGVDCDSFRSAFREAMDDDFNTPEAIAVLFELARELNRSRDADPDAAGRLAGCLRELGAVLGLLQADPVQFLHETTAAQAGQGGLGSADIEAMIAERIAAREQKNWAEADRIRDELERQGVVLEDGPEGTSWRRS
ncbi:MAG: cysteine--tRNA ligase [Xanthomonadales bacterium]|nr:cysteine--tRNA ligase [Xanthomonadales bacterium]NIX13908.1 cysteine--tRNA ligase [Xanthomonadales bacterium]